MKYLTFILALILFNSCSSNQEPSAVIKKYRTKKYSAKTINNQIEKDSLQVEYEIGNDSNGNQTYFVGFVGYSNNDTTWFQSKTNKKEEGNKTFYYDENNEVQTVLIRKGDTSFMYSGSDLDEPISYQIIDENGTKSRVDLSMGKKENYEDRVFDKQGNLTYYIIKETYSPTKYDKKYRSKGELLKKEAEMLKTNIVEIEYEYY